MTPMHEFLRYWESACERKDLPKLVAEVVVSEAVRSQAARLGRELLLACALDPWEADDVLSEIALLTMSDEGDATWRLRRLSGAEAAVIAGGHLSAHFATSFLLATRIRSPSSAKPRRSRSSSADAR